MDILVADHLLRQSYFAEMDLEIDTEFYTEKMEISNSLLRGEKELCLKWCRRNNVEELEFKLLLEELKEAIGQAIGKEGM